MAKKLKQELPGESSIIRPCVDFQGREGRAQNALAITREPSSKCLERFHDTRHFGRMIARGTLEAEISRKLSNVSDADMQRLAEAYARIRFPDRFGWLDGRAINAEGQTIAGRADGFVVAPDGSRSLIEATRFGEKRRVTDRRHKKGHFHEAIAKIRIENSATSEFIYVAGHPKVQFSEPEFQILRGEAAEAGIPRDRITIVGGDGLIDALCEPKMARARIELLGIDAPVHFTLVRRDLGPDLHRQFEQGAASLFIPSPEDLAAGLVHFPSLWGAVKEDLSTARVCLVRGLGASGKSVLAWLAGLHWEAQFRPSYVADLQYAVTDQNERARQCIEELVRLSDPSALFIIDNCHLDEELAWKIFDTWKGLGSVGPALLLLGRETRSRTGSGIYGVRLEPRLLRARSREVRGVYHRLVARHLRSQGKDANPLTPPQTEAERWVSTFGDRSDLIDGTTDLIAFSAAVQRKMDCLLRGEWLLTEEDAAEEIRIGYLARLPEAERENLYRLAALQNLELDVEACHLPNVVAGLDTASKKFGIVFTRDVGWVRKYTRYELAHASLGRLILAAAQRQSDEILEYKAVAAQSGFAGFFLVNRMLAIGKVTEAKVIADLISGMPELFLALPFKYWTGLLETLQRAGGPISKESVEALCDPVALEQLAGAAGNGHLGHFGKLLVYLERSGTSALRNRLLPALAVELQNSRHLGNLLDSAFRTPLGQLALFLSALEKSRLPALREALLPSLVAELEAPTHRYKLVDIAVGTQFGELASFLGSLEKSRCAAVAERLLPTVAVELEKPAYRSELINTALRLPLGSLASFLSYLGKSRLSAFRKTLLPALAAELGKPINRSKVVANAVRTQPGELASFLGALEKSPVPALREMLLSALATELERPANRSKLVDTAVRNQLSELAYFLSYLEKSRLPAVSKKLLSALAADFAKPTSLQKLAEACCKTDAGHLARFLDTLEQSPTTALRRMRQIVASYLCGSDVRKALVEHVLSVPLDHLAGFLAVLRRDENLDPILHEIVIETREADDCAGFLSGMAIGSVQEVELCVEMGGDLSAGIRDLERVVKIFGSSRIRDVEGVVIDARALLGKYHKALAGRKAG